MSMTTEWVPARILGVEDTRALELDENDRWVRVPGTGLEHLCDRCGRLHEIHAAVLGDDGQEHLVGVSCAHATGPIQAQLRSALSATATVDKLRAALDVARARDAHLASVRAEVEALAPPEVVSESQPHVGGNDWTWHTADGTCRAHGRSLTWYQSHSDYYTRPESAWAKHDAERRECVLHQWRDQQLRARGIEPREQPSADDVAGRLAKAERRLRALLA